MVKRWLTLHLSEPQFLPVSPLSQLPRYWKDGDNLGLFLVPSIAQVRTVFDSLEAFGSLLWSERPWCPVCKARLCLRICGPPCCVHLPQGSPPHEARHPPSQTSQPVPPPAERGDCLLFHLLPAEQQQTRPTTCAWVRMSELRTPRKPGWS